MDSAMTIRAEPLLGSVYSSASLGLATAVICTAISGLAVWRLEPLYVNYNESPFSPWQCVALLVILVLPGSGLLLGATLSNLMASVIWDGVPDYISIGPYTFNLADILIVAGVLEIAVSTRRRVL